MEEVVTYWVTVFRKCGTTYVHDTLESAQAYKVLFPHCEIEEVVTTRRVIP
jgi:hypothetical protein